MMKRNIGLLFFFIAFPALGADRGGAEDAMVVAKINSLPIQQCQHDLAKLHSIYQEMKNMSAAEQQAYLEQIGQNIKNLGIQIPPPPAPCSAPDLALEARCGNLDLAKSRCGS